MMYLSEKLDIEVELSELIFKILILPIEKNMEFIKGDIREIFIWFRT